MNRLVVPVHCPPSLQRALTRSLDATTADLVLRRFPDGETYVRVRSPCEGADVVLLCSLDRPDPKTMQILLCARALRDLGANSIGLVAPYLAYMRQDRRFNPGEGVTSRYFAELISAHFDWLVTVDPHLHRYSDLSEIYSIPSRVAHAAPALAEWIGANVEAPLLIGPDEESAQWVADVAGRANVPHIVLRKIRHGDSDVEVSVPEVDRWQGHTPVLVDDIVSTARTMAETAGHLRRLGMKAPVCVGVHAIFSGDADRVLATAGIERVVTCDTVVHGTNVIEVGGFVADAVRELTGAHG